MIIVYRNDEPPPRNSPFVICGVLVLVLGIVGAIALAGRMMRPIAGTPVTRSPVAGSGTSSATASPSPSVPSEADTADRTAPEMTLHDVTCRLPELGRDEEQMHEFYTAALVCLDEAWREPLENAGAQFEPPVLETVDSRDSACEPPEEEEEVLASYCGLDSVIHMPSQILLASLGRNLPAHLAVLAHEYGHHVQNVNGTLNVVDRKRMEVDSGSAEELEMVRRLELQANCFSGLFLASAAGRGSVTYAHAEAAVADFANYGSSDTHGTSANQMRWGSAGFEEGIVSACDTWSAAADEVA